MAEDEKVESCLGVEETKLKGVLTDHRERMIVQCCSGTVEDISKCIEDVDETIEKIIKQV